MENKEKLKAAFDQVHAGDALKSNTKNYLFEHVYKKGHVPRTFLRRFAVSAACSLLVFLAGGSYLFFTPTAFISVDVNPSLELGINRFDRVVSVTGYNEDGQNLADNLSLKYVESSMSEHENVYCHSSNTEELHHAHDAGLSFGKYQSWEILQDLDAGISLEEIQDMTMTEIRDLIWKYSQEKFQENPMSGDSENMEDSQECPLDGSQDSSDEENSLKHLHGHHGQSEDE